MQAKDLKSFQKAEVMVNQVEIWEKACELEKQKQWFPTNCLQLLQLRFQKPDKEGVLEVSLAQVRNLCLSQVQSLKNRKVLHELLGHQVIPSQCRSALLERIEDLKYSMGIKGGPDFETR